MPENSPKKNAESEKDAEREKKSTLTDDQRERSYYYDDACGYEVYLPDEIEDEDENHSKNDN